MRVTVGIICEGQAWSPPFFFAPPSVTLKSRMHRHGSSAGKRVTWALACCVAMGFSASASAQGSVCKYIDANGNIVFTNVAPDKGLRKLSCLDSDDIGKKSATPARTTPTPAGFPRVDADTQRGRDDVRRRVLSEELATEEKLLAEARTSYANGAPVPLPEEQANAERYRDRIGRLRQAVQLHERNIDALKKELGTTR